MRRYPHYLINKTRCDRDNTGKTKNKTTVNNIAHIHNNAAFLWRVTKKLSVGLFFYPDKFSFIRLNI